MDKIKDASQLSPGNQIFLPEGTNVKASAISNRIGQIMTLQAYPNNDNIPSYSCNTKLYFRTVHGNCKRTGRKKLMQWLVFHSYQVQGVKPTGCNCRNRIISTLENVESDRYETQLNAVVRLCRHC